PSASRRRRSEMRRGARLPALHRGAFFLLGAALAAVPDRFAKRPSPHKALAMWVRGWRLSIEQGETNDVERVERGRPRQRRPGSQRWVSLRSTHPTLAQRLPFFDFALRAA